MLNEFTSRAAAETWRPFSTHAVECRECGLMVERITAPRWLPVGAAWEACCAEGRELLEPYLQVCMTLLEDGPIARVRRKMGLGGDDERERIAALADIPPDAYRDLVRVDDDGAREAQIRAIMAGYRARHRDNVVHLDTGQGDQTMSCRGCKKNIPRKQGPFCSRQCREQWQNRQP